MDGKKPRGKILAVRAASGAMLGPHAITQIRAGTRAGPSIKSHSFFTPS